MQQFYGYGFKDRKLEAYATWGMLPACLPSHRQRVVPKQLTTFELIAFLSDRNSHRFNLTASCFEDI